MYNMICQASTIISSNVSNLVHLRRYWRLERCLGTRDNRVILQIYREDDAPNYRRGNKILLALVAWNVVMTAFIKVYYVRRNRIRNETWNSMSPSERDDYLRNTKDEGNKRLDFRFAH